MGWGPNSSRRPGRGSGGFQSPPPNDLPKTATPVSASKAAVRKPVVVIVGSGAAFNGRAVLRQAFDEMGLEVVEYSTSAIDADEKTPVIGNNAVPQLIRGACLTIIMLSESSDKGPSIERLEKLLLQHARSGIGAVGIVASEPGLLMNHTQPHPTIAFAVLPVHGHDYARRNGYGMRFFGMGVLDDPAKAKSAAATMAEYGGVKRPVTQD